MGNILRAEDGEGHAVLYGYDLNGNMVSRIDQLGARESFGYDRENRLVSMTDRNGTRTHITYNMYHSITGRRAVTADQSSTVTESYGYYPDGSLRYAIGGGMRYDYSYDAMGRLVKKSASGRSLLVNEYDLNGNRIAMTDLTGKRTEYRYNSLDQLEAVVDNGKAQVHYTYNADGTIRRMEVGTGLVTEYTYDQDKNVISQKTVLAGIEGMSGTDFDSFPTLHNMNHRDRSKPFTLADYAYTYDANGNRIGKQTQAGLTAYHYDATQRLVKVDYPTASEEYRYDKAGNRMEKWVNGSMAEQYAYDAANRMVSRSLLTANSDGTLTTRESHEYAYDPQGNMLSDGKRSFTYDAANRLSHVTTQDGNTQVNRYDGEGLRAEMEENGRLVQFLFDGDKVVAETDCEGTNIRYIRGYELVSSDCEKARTYYHYASDELGSITHVTDEAGNVCNHYEYDAFGDFTVREETVANRFGFTGEQYDPVAGLYYLRARFYNPVIGRFIQEDTYYGDGLNLYAYCGNNPVRYVDPSGHKKECPIVTDIGNQLKALGFKDVDIENLKGKLKYKHAKTKNALLDKILNSENSFDDVQKIIDDYINGKKAHLTNDNGTPQGRMNMANKVDPKTGVKFDEDGFPIFESLFNMDLEPEDYMKSRTTHFDRASKALYEAIQKNPQLKSLFTESEIELFKNGLVPSRFTWHHHQKPGKMQLVYYQIHADTWHIGGFSIWGKGNKKG